MNKTLFTAEWYENDALDEYEGFCSDVVHQQSAISTLASAKEISQRNALEHDVMVVGMVTECRYYKRYGWKAVAEYVSEYCNGKYQPWEKAELE
ncbi:MAG: hypothetical protein ACPGEF_03530 [Endozoicomonas sp.]